MAILLNILTYLILICLLFVKLFHFYTKSKLLCVIQEVKYVSQWLAYQGKGWGKSVKNETLSDY